MQISTVYVGRYQRFRGAYDEAMTSLQAVRSRSVAAEHRYNFSRRRSSSHGSATNKKAKLASTWTHIFYCLASCDQEKLFTTSALKNELILAGLGEKKIKISNIDCNVKEFHEEIMNSFPKLRNAGGFEFLKCKPSSRMLEIIPFGIANSPRHLKTYVGTAKVYIRPIQVDLDLVPTQEFTFSNEVILSSNFIYPHTMYRWI